MELRCLDKKNFDTIRNNSICLVRYSEDHLDELCDTYNILPRISLIIDRSRSKHGVKQFRGRRLEVCGEERLSVLEPDAVLLITSYYYKAEYAWLSSNSFVKKRFRIIYFFPDYELSYDISYREKYADVPLKNRIIFRSGPGASHYVPGTDFNDNARVLFDYMLSRGFNEKYELVWIVHEPSDYASMYEKEKNVRFLPFSGAVAEDVELRDQYYEVLCLAKYIFMTDSHAFARNARQDQIRVQLWHGQGFKSCTTPFREEESYEYMTVSSKFYSKRHAMDFGLRSEQLLITGIPKEDLIFSPLSDWRSRLRIPQACHYIFWLPTFRTTRVAGLEHMDVPLLHKETGLPLISNLAELQKLNVFLRDIDVMLLVKLHPYQDREAVANERLSNIFVLENEILLREGIQINELLGNAEAMISDYSSAIVDFMLLDRPIAVTLDDCVEYGATQGFGPMMKNIRDWLPGEELFSFEDLVRFIKNVVEGKDLYRDKRRELNSIFHEFHDGENCARILDVLGIHKENACE